MNNRKILFWIYNALALFLYFTYRWLDLLTILKYQSAPEAFSIERSLLVMYWLTPVLALLTLNILYTRLFLKEWTIKRVLVISLIELAIGVPLFAFLSGLIVFLLLGSR